MNIIRPIAGVIPVVQTPLQVDGSVDLAAQARLMKFLGARSIGGFWCLGTGSEDYLENSIHSSRKLVAEVMCEANSGKLPLVLGCSFIAFKIPFNFIEETQNLDFTCLSNYALSSADKSGQVGVDFTGKLYLFLKPLFM